MLDPSRNDSTALLLASRIKEKLHAAAHRSASLRVLSPILPRDRSRDTTLSSPSIRRVLDDAAARSGLKRASAAVRSVRVRRAIANSRLAAAGATFRRYVESSLSYRWLTTAPDSKLVIDLRDTRTVGPPVRAIDRLFSELAPSITTSAVVKFVCGFGSLVQTRPVYTISLFVFPISVASLLTLTFTDALSISLLLGHLLAAGLATIGLHSQRKLKDVLEMRIVRFLVAAFQPPPESSGMSENRPRRDKERKGE